VVLHVAPREAVRDHFEVDEPLAGIDAAHLAVVAINVDHLDVDDLAEHFAGDVFSSLGSERLTFFRERRSPSATRLRGRG
jgi:hypothetical protein